MTFPNNPTLKWKLLVAALIISNLVCAFVFYRYYQRKSEPIYRSSRPQITDRNGHLLVASQVNSERKEIAYRYANDPECAAAFLGYVSHVPYDDHGLSGLEKVIDDCDLGKAVTTTLDYPIQMGLENLVEETLQKADGLKYIHATIISSDGELIATSQRPVMAIAKKRTGSPESTVFLPAAYLVPVSGKMMALLGCPPDASAQQKEQYLFHIKQGFSGEARGFVRGLNKKMSEKEEENSVLQAATPINYLLAYCASREQTPIKQLETISLRRLGRIRLQKQQIEWKLIDTAENKAAINAIGEIPACIDSREVRLYVFLRAVCAEHDAGLTPALQKKYEAVCDKVYASLTKKQGEQQ